MAELAEMCKGIPWRVGMTRHYVLGGVGGHWNKHWSPWYLLTSEGLKCGFNQACVEGAQETEPKTG